MLSLPLSLFPSLCCSVNLLGVKVLTGRSGVSLLLQKTKTPLLSRNAHPFCLLTPALSFSPSLLFHSLLLPFSSSHTLCFAEWLLWIAAHLPKFVEVAKKKKKSGPGVIQVSGSGEQLGVKKSRRHGSSHRLLTPHNGLLVDVCVCMSEPVCVGSVHNRVQHLIVTDLINFQADC